MSLILLVSAAFPATGRKDPDTGRIRVLYIGDHGSGSPSPIMDAEPLISLRVAVAYFHISGADRKRLNRLYFPRTYAILAQYDSIIVSDAPVNAFDDKHHVWIKDAVIDNGTGFVMIGGNGGFGGRPELPWNPTPVADILPVEGVAGGWGGGRVEIIRPDHEFILSLPLERRWDWMQNYDGNEVVLKQEADLLAEIVIPHNWEHRPFWATWDIGEGRSFANIGDWTYAAGVVFMRWPYYGDFAVNLMMYLSKNPIPSDLETLHRARNLYLTYRSTRAYLFSIIEFAEKFGANIDIAGEMVTEADEMHAASIDLYLDLDFENAIDQLQLAIDQMLDASERAMGLKDQAMLWIYIAEWSVVTASFFLAIFLVWALMVKRRLYRQVARTRFAG
ncbi:MAG: hypothetical protein HXS50_00945 [Theionarchaea archaeon]|nr:hypothetical protein [Theionarchaea archaeon]